MRKRLGEILINSGWLTNIQLEEALILQKKEGNKTLLGKILIKLGYASEEQIAAAVAEQNDFAYLPLSCYEADKELLQTVSLDIILKYNFVPVDKIGKMITIAVVEEIDAVKIEEVEKILGCSIKIFVAKFSEFQEYLKNNYDYDPNIDIESGRDE